MSLWHRARETRAILAERFPFAIANNGQGETKKPLKIGIYQDIRERAPDLPPMRVKEFLNVYASGKNYLGCLTPGAERIDLDGKHAGFVVARDAEAAEQRSVTRRSHWIILNALREIADAPEELSADALRLIAKGALTRLLEKNKAREAARERAVEAA